jgi:predicted DNA-binding protein (MmcQ/YjbR family)
MMNFESLRQYLLGKPGASEEFPFGPSAMVFKVKSKMFALIAVQENPLRLNLKCDSELALHLRAAYDAVEPGYHMNKKHWNTITIDGTIPDEEIQGMIDDSYNLVVKGLPKGDRKSLGV